MRVVGEKFYPRHNILALGPRFPRFHRALPCLAHNQIDNLWGALTE